MDNEPHGNSKKSQKPQHLYSIHDASENDEVVKFGISGQPLNKDGTSPRANAQVSKWNLVEGWKRFWAQILQTDIENREKGLKEEIDKVKDFQAKSNGDLPLKQKRPDPSKRKKKQ